MIQMPKRLDQENIGDVDGVRNGCVSNNEANSFAEMTFKMSPSSKESPCDKVSPLTTLPLSKESPVVKSPSLTISEESLVMEQQPSPVKREAAFTNLNVSPLNKNIPILKSHTSSINLTENVTIKHEIESPKAPQDNGHSESFHESATLLETEKPKNDTPIKVEESHIFDKPHSQNKTNELISNAGPSRMESNSDDEIECLGFFIRAPKKHMPVKPVKRRRESDDDDIVFICERHTKKVIAEVVVDADDDDKVRNESTNGVDNNENVNNILIFPTVEQTTEDDVVKKEIDEDMNLDEENNLKTSVTNENIFENKVNEVVSDLCSNQKADASNNVSVVIKTENVEDLVAKQMDSKECETVPNENIEGIDALVVKEEKDSESINMNYEMDGAVSSLERVKQEKDSESINMNCEMEGTESSLERPLDSVKKERDDEICNDTSASITNENQAETIKPIIASDSLKNFNFNSLNHLNKLPEIANDEELCETAPSSPVHEDVNVVCELTPEELEFSKLLMSVSEMNFLNAETSGESQDGEEVFESASAFRIQDDYVHFGCLKQLNYKMNYFDLLNCASVLSKIKEKLDDNNKISSLNFKECILQSLSLYDEDSADFLNTDSNNFPKSPVCEEQSQVFETFSSSCNNPVFFSLPHRESPVYVSPNTEVFDMKALRCLEDWDKDEISSVISLTSLSDGISGNQTVGEVVPRKRSSNSMECEKVLPTNAESVSGVINYRRNFRSSSEMPHKIHRNDATTSSPSSDFLINFTARANRALINDPLNPPRFDSELEDSGTVMEFRGGKVKDLRELLNRKNNFL